MKKIYRIVQLWNACWRITLRDAVIYRLNTIFFLIFESIFFVANFYAVHLGFELAQGSINGWTKEEGLLVSAIFSFTHHIFLTFFAAFIFDIGEKAASGTLDFVLLKPCRPLVTLWVTTAWIVQNIPNILISGGVLLYLMVSSSLHSGGLLWTNFIFCLFFIFLGILIRLSLGILCVSSVFFSEKLHAADTYWNTVAIANYPKIVFPRFFQYVFTFVLPVTLISTVPAEVFFGRGSWSYFLSCMIVALLFTFFSIRFFYWSLKSYKSVNAGV